MITSIDELLYIVNGKKFKCFRETDGELTNKGEDVLQQLLDILYACQDMNFKFWKNIDIDMVEQEINDIIRKGY